jgi:L-seryl-tRNA(Ser) seleniumtransferase
VLRAPQLADAIDAVGREMAADVVRALVDQARSAAVDGAPVPDARMLAEAASNRVAEWSAPLPVRVINATGVIVHTNLGRAPLSHNAAQAMARAAVGYCALEYDLAAGERGSRHDLLGSILLRVTGAEAGLVVNNNAGATLLVLTALARGRDVLVSRGELIEIGGGFRLPEVFEAGGARLQAVGTTNRTYASDYERVLASSEEGRIGLILRVHTSNFRLTGFTARPPLEELVALGRAYAVPVVDDLGSGSLLDTSSFGLAKEPIVPESVAAGADLVTFSGDKLLGGPQAGVIVGNTAAVATLRKHPLTRALRPGKDVFAALHATLLHYVRGDALEAVPVWRMIAATPDGLAPRAAAWRDALELPAGWSATLTEAASTVGGGSLPGETLPTAVLALEGPDPDALAASLRHGATPVVARIHEGRVLLDPRTVLPEEDRALVRALADAMRSLPAA